MLYAWFFVFCLNWLIVSKMSWYKTEYHCCRNDILFISYFWLSLEKKYIIMNCDDCYYHFKLLVGNALNILTMYNIIICSLCYVHMSYVHMLYYIPKMMDFVYFLPLISLVKKYIYQWKIRESSMENNHEFFICFFLGGGH